MTPDTIEQELNAFVEEYSPYLRAVSTSLVPVTTDRASAHVASGTVTFTTAEGETYTCNVGDAGWQVPGSTTFSTSQEMLSTLSPQFRADWAMQLLKRIETLAANQLEPAEESDKRDNDAIDIKQKEGTKPVITGRLL